MFSVFVSYDSVTVAASGGKPKGEDPDESDTRSITYPHREASITRTRVAVAASGPSAAARMCVVRPGSCGNQRMPCQADWRIRGAFDTAPRTAECARAVVRFRGVARRSRSGEGARLSGASAFPPATAPPHCLCRHGRCAPAGVERSLTRSCHSHNRTALSGSTPGTFVEFHEILP